MTEELLPGSTIPTVSLSSERSAAYVETLQKVFRGARLNSFYPDSRRLGEHVSALSPEVHRGLYSELQVHQQSGLPSYREWTRVQTDVTIAADQLRQLGSRAELAVKAAGRPDTVWGKQLLKSDYYSDIVGIELSTLGDMDVALRRVDHGTGAASFHVVLDKLDVSGLFVRYTIDLEQQRANLKGSSIRVDEREIAKQSEDFQGLVYKFTSLDAEFTFVKLATLGDMAPERVTKGVVGPIWFEFTDAPRILRPLLGDGGFVASFGFDTAAVDVAQQRNNDPFSQLAEERLSPDELRSYNAARAQFGYRVFKDRKFVVPVDRVEALRKVLETLGTKNIIYGV